MKDDAAVRIPNLLEFEDTKVPADNSKEGFNILSYVNNSDPHAVFENPYCTLIEGDRQWIATNFMVKKRNGKSCR